METGRMSEGTGGSPGSLSSLSDKGKSGRFFVRNHIAHRGPLNHPIVTADSGFSLRFSRDLRADLGLDPGPDLGTGSTLPHLLPNGWSRPCAMAALQSGSDRLAA